jgi:CheY-like chemotaxis protein
MSLQSLVLCSDEKIVRVLRRVLSDLEISVEHCADPDAAMRRLTRQRFEAVIVDCSDESMASRVLRSARTAPCNKHAIAVAIIDGQKAVHSAFELGAHFVLYKPISAERAKSSFRAARALMKCERRRNTRVAVEIPVTIVSGDRAGQQRSVSSDLSEGGMAIPLARRPQGAGSLRVQFVLPGTDYKVDCAAAVAWENAGRQAGIRFADLSPEARVQLKLWLNRHSPEMEKDDPPVACKLTDLSLGACYLEMASPFPAQTRIILSMSVAKLQVQVEGVVRVMHPEAGMGVEFTQKTTRQREQVEKFIQALMDSNGVLPDIVVQPEGMNDPDAGTDSPPEQELEDPLLDLFRHKLQLSAEAFQLELRRQRGAHPAASEAVVSA